MRKIIFLLACLLSLNLLASGKKDFADIKAIDPSIQIEMRYYGNHNFVGQRVHGYKAPKCLLTKEAATALGQVQADLKKKNLSLLLYDCYRPQKGVNHFIRWAKDLKESKMKKEFYPNVAKENLFRDGYIAAKSGHSRGSAIDLTIAGLDMGSPYDFFDPISHTMNPKIKGQARHNRLLLKRVMERHGFKNYDKEWWHYSLQKEPFPNQYFDFDVK